MTQESSMLEKQALEQEAEDFRSSLARITEAVGNVIVGQERVVECTLAALVAGGNVLLEGVPGLGKTELVKTLARALDLDFKRIQFTPDLMPADIVGTKVMVANPDRTYSFEFRRGPVFTQLLLADEINRATPKTQSALLETMQEHSVTADGITQHLQAPFMVLATQNPIEQEGTYPLPEAQLDRFMFKATVPFLSREEFGEVMNRTILREATEVPTVADGPKLLELRAVLDEVVVAEPISDYAVRLVLATHPDTDSVPENVRRYVRWGASPRAGQALLKGARVRALTSGRAHVSFADIRWFAVEVLQHRVLLNYDGQAESIRVSDLIEEIIQSIPEEPV